MKTRITAPRAAGFALLWLLAFMSAVRAQQPDLHPLNIQRKVQRRAISWPAPPGTPAHHQLRFRGQPLPYTRWFLVTEVGALMPLQASSSTSDDATAHSLLQAEFGLMRNTSSRWAFGGTILLQTEHLGDSLRWALRPRARYWLARQLSLDLSPGVVVGKDLNHGYGWCTSATLGVADWIAWSFYLGSLSRTVTTGTYANNGWITTTHVKSATTLYTGVTFQSYGSILAGVAAGLALVAVADALSSMDFSFSVSE
jgi:hypothetical protein